MDEGRHRTGGQDERALDALLAALTEPGEDPAFRARVLSRLDASVDDARRSRPWRWAASGVLVAAALVAVTFSVWRPDRPAGHDAARSETEAPAASPAGGSLFPANSSGGPWSGTSAPSAGELPAQQLAMAGRRTRAAAREPQAIEARDTLGDDQPLPYGMERIRLEPVTIQPFALREVREDPRLAALAAPEPVRVDPIDVEEIAPRR